MRSRHLKKVGKAARASGLPGLFVLLSLLALLVVPIAVQQRASALRNEVNEVAVPATQLLSDVRYLLARQTSTLRGYLISRDTADLRRYSDLAAIEQSIYPELEALAAELSPDFAADVAELRILSEQWHDRLMVDLIAGSGPGGPPPGVLLEEGLYLASLEAAGRATESARRSMEIRESEIRAVDRSGRIINGLLFLLGIAAALSVANLNARIRSLANDAERRRREIEGVMLTTERAVAARADLIRGFTHDVKNPLGVADGYAELLELGLRGELSELQLQTVQRIRGSINGAVEIINELLDLSRLESGGLQLRREEVDLPSLALDIVEEQLRAAEAGGLDLSFVKPAPRAPRPRTYTDPDRVRQIIQNLVSNALKYTPPPGTIRVEVQFSAQDPERPGAWAKVKVIDSGPGIPLEEQERIFDEFHRVPGTAVSGHGLGLAISRRIAHLLGGDVTVRSALGQGSTFVLWLPLRDEADTLPSSASASMAGRETGP